MDVTPEGRQRLAHLMEERRLDLQLEWKEVASRAGLVYETLRALRAGDAGAPTPLTLRKVDKGLEWMPGSSQRVLEGRGDPQDVLSPAERQTLEQYGRAASSAAERSRNGKSA